MKPEISGSTRFGSLNELSASTLSLTSWIASRVSLSWARAPISNVSCALRAISSYLFRRSSRILDKAATCALPSVSSDTDDGTDRAYMSVSSGGSLAMSDDLRRCCEPTVLERFRGVPDLLGEEGKTETGADDGVYVCFNGGGMSTATSALAVVMSEAAAAWCDR